MENNKLAELQAKCDALKKAIKYKQRAMDYFDVTDYYDEDMFIEEMEEAWGYVEIMGMQYSAVDTLRKVDSIAFREMYNNHIDTLDKNDLEEYRELEEDLEELENELLEIEEKIEQLDNE